MDDQNYKNMSPKTFPFRKVLKIREKVVNPQILHFYYQQL